MPDTIPTPEPTTEAPSPPASTHRVAVGRINSTWGLRGHVKITAYSSNPLRYQRGATLIVQGTPRRVLDVNSSQGYPIVQFEGYTSITRAETLRGALIEIDEADLPALPEGEYYLHDLIGIAIVTAAGERIGTLVEVLTTGANDVYLVRREDKPDALIPAIPDVILRVDLEAHTMTIEPLPGLLD
jgi:16S rRNA processing protein RimM